MLKIITLQNILSFYKIHLSKHKFSKPWTLGVNKTSKPKKTNLLSKKKRKKVGRKRWKSTFLVSSPSSLLYIWTFCCSVQLLHIANFNRWSRLWWYSYYKRDTKIYGNGNFSHSLIYFRYTSKIRSRRGKKRFLLPAFKPNRNFWVLTWIGFGLDLVLVKYNQFMKL